MDRGSTAGASMSPATALPVATGLEPASCLALTARSLLRSMPALDRGPRTALTQLGVATVEATAFRAALTLLAARPTGHRTIAKTAAAVLPRGPGRALAEAVSAWESGDAARTERLASQESQEIRRRLEGSPFAAAARAAEGADLRLLQALPAALDFRQFFAQPLFVTALPRELEHALTAWLGYLRDLGMPAAAVRRYRELLEGSFPEPPTLLSILDAWANRVERLPSESTSAAALRSGLTLLPAAGAAQGEAEVASGPGPVGRFTALDESLAERDLLGRQSLVDALAAMCADRRQGTPFTLALLAEWGAGKSSAMNLLRRTLAAEAGGRGRFIPVWFNAWSYENTGNMAAALAQEVVAGLLSGLGWWRKLVLRVRFAARQHRSRLAWAGIRLLSTAIMLLAAHWAFRGAEPLLQSMLGVGLAAGLVAFAATLRRDFKQLWEHPLAIELKTFLKLPDYGKHLGFLPVVREHLRTLCDLRLGRPREGARRLVCFVDDLDRCRSETLIQTLEAIRLLDEKDCIVILGFDPRIALAAIGERCKELETADRSRRQIARDYLGKVVQLAIRLDAGDPAHLEHFIAEQLFPVPAGEPAPAVPRSAPAPDLPAAPSSAALPGAAAAAPARSAGAPGVTPSSSVDLSIEMWHTVEEQVLFSRLAAAYRFSNPRLLLRLRNGYRFLRLVEAESGRRAAPLALLMSAIFWQEFLNQWPREMRVRLDAALLAEEPPAGLPPAACEVVGHVARALQDLLAEKGVTPSAYRTAAALASLLVLPYGD